MKTNAQTRPVLFLLSVILFPALVQGQFRYLEITPQTAQYEIYVGNRLIGEASLIIRPQRAGSPDTLLFRWKAEGLFHQDIRVAFLRAPNLKPLWSKFHSQRGTIRTSVTTHYRQGKAEGTIVRQPSKSKPRRFRISVPDSVVDLGLVRLAVRLTPLAVNRVVKFPVLDVREGRVVPGKGWVSRLVDVQVPAGTFRCYRVEMFTGLAQEIDFIEARPPHRLVRQIFPAVDVDIRLVK